MKNLKIFLFVILTASVVFLTRSFLLPSVKAQSSNSDASDAIAVRIIPNPNHYSISRWYESQGFSGAPQELTVDGYEAVRDGRTVYVNATNVEGKNIYTNVYLISYNQTTTNKTVDILGQIISHWKFNSNDFLTMCIYKFSRTDQFRCFMFVVFFYSDDWNLYSPGFEH